MAPLTRSKQDYLKALWALAPAGEPVPTSHLAAQLGVSAPSVTHMLGRLAAEDLVAHAPRAGARLTPRGRRAALGMVRRHRILETFLVEVLGLDWAEVHDDAEVLEHHVSDRVLEALDRVMGHPAEDPHGSLIPDAKGRLARRVLAPLAALPRGTYARVREVPEADGRRLARWKELGLVPGARVRVREVREADGVIELEVGGRRVATAGAALDGVLVETVPGGRMEPEAGVPSLPEMHGTVPVPSGGRWLRRLFAFSGPAYLVSVGYMDPGNWATDLAGGARFGYQLIWVLLASNLMAVLLQTLSARLGVVTGKDLAQECRDSYPRAVAIPLWIGAEVAIVACDLAEVLGAAIGLKLLFGLPLLWGVVVTALDVLLLLGLSRLGMRRLEAVILVLIATMGACFAFEIALSKPVFGEVLRAFLPRGEDGRPSLFAPAAGGGWSVLGLHGGSLYIAIGMLGATVMPHNLYLHSALVQSRSVARSPAGKREAARMNLVDSAVALNAAFFVNAAILVLAASTFHGSGHQDVARLEDAHRLLAPLLGTGAASVVFAIALLSSGQSSTITGTLAGQVVMEGFLRLRIQPWLRRVISRGLAIIPAGLVIGLRGPDAVDALLVLSQVVLSLQLSFAVIPLVTFTGDRRRMGDFVNPPWLSALAWFVALFIAALNGKLVLDLVGEWFATAGPGAWWLPFLVLPVILGTVVLLAVVMLMPLLRRLLPPLARLPVRVGPGAPALPMLAERSTGARVISATGPRRVALALELSSADAEVLEQARGMALPADVRVILMHVAESAASRYLGQETLDEESRTDLATLERLAAGLRAFGLETDVLLGNGDVKTELARMVKEWGADLLITGSHGHRLLGDLFLGSTASGLRHRVSCPVLTIRSRRP